MRRADWMGDAALGALDKDDEGYNTDHACNEQDDPNGSQSTPGAVGGFVPELTDAVGQAGDDAGEDEQAHAVADASVSDLLAEPHDEGGAGGQGEDGEQDEGHARIEDGVHLGEDGGDADGLQRSQDDRHVTGPLGDLAAAEFAFLLDACQRLINDGEELEDDGCRNVRHDAEGKDGHAAEVAATEEVRETEERAALGVEHHLQSLGVNARCGNERAEAVDG